MTSLRKEIETDIYEMLDDLDPSGANTERMKEFFKPMSDKQFFTYVDDFYSDPNKNYVCSYRPYDNPVTIAFIEKICKKYGIPLYEYVYEPYLNGDKEDPPRTVHKILVVDIPEKRLKQMVLTKNHTAVNPTKIDPRTGQTSGHDRIARITSPELYSLIVQNGYSVAEELFGPLADDSNAYYEMLREIQKTGEVSMEDISHDPADRVSLNTINTYILGSCLTSNIIDESGYALSTAMKNRASDEKRIKRG